MLYQIVTRFRFPFVKIADGRVSDSWDDPPPEWGDPRVIRHDYPLASMTLKKAMRGVNDFRVRTMRCGYRQINY